MSKTWFVVQRVNITWSKASRGGEGARRRSSLPKAFSLPLECFAAPFAFHRVHLSESTGFDAREATARGQSFADLDLRDLLITPVAKSVKVELIRDPQNAAMSNRTFWDASGNIVDRVGAFTLMEGEWGQLEYSGRYVDRDTGDWWYEHSIYNIALLIDVSVDRFVSGRPDRRYAELPKLR